MTTERELRTKLAEIEDPCNDADIVSLGLVNDVAVADGTATVSLAFNSPYAPAEMELGDEIRDAVADLGLEPDLRAQVGPEQGFDDEILPGVKNVIAVASGKGGVGKTTVAANLAAGLDRLGARVGVLDADVHGPNVPRLLPIEGDPGITPDEEVVPPESEGVAVMSMDYLTDGDDPAILRGPMVNQVMRDFVESVRWGSLDYLVVDLPPGTGDASLNLLQSLPVAGVVVVTTPQEMAVDDARKGLRLFERHDTPILGVVENMAGVRCPSCGDRHEVFGTGGAAAICEDYGVPLLGSLPAHPDFDSGRLDGPVVRAEDSELQDDAVELTETVADRIGAVNRGRLVDDRDEERDEAADPGDGAGAGETDRATADGPSCWSPQ
jgi:ATP-binding protein involved in chromosome partitioning